MHILTSQPAPAWAASPHQLVLPTADVHVWKISLKQTACEMEILRSHLSHDERERERRYHFARDRDRFAACRGVLRVLFSRYLGQSPGSIAFGHESNEKPFVCNRGLPHEVAFNVSHSNDVALIAFTHDRPIGIDIERVNTDVDLLSIAQRYFSLHEFRNLARLEANDRAVAFYRYWVNKEAYLKASGVGLSGPLDIDCNLLIGWALHNRPSIGGYEWAVAIENQGADIRFSHFDY